MRKNNFLCTKETVSTICLVAAAKQWKICFVLSQDIRCVCLTKGGCSTFRLGLPLWCELKWNIVAVCWECLKAFLNSVYYNLKNLAMVFYFCCIIFLLSASLLMLNISHFNCKRSCIHYFKRECQNKVKCVTMKLILWVIPVIWTTKVECKEYLIYFPLVLSSMKQYVYTYGRNRLMKFEIIKLSSINTRSFVMLKHRKYWVSLNTCGPSHTYIHMRAF